MQTTISAFPDGELYVGQKIKTRAKILVFFFLAWAATLGAYIFHYTVVARDGYRQQSRDLSEREGWLPAMRGRILDKDGRPLAWSTRHYDLRVRDSQTHLSVKRKTALMTILSRHIPGLSCDDLVPGRTIKKDLTPAEIQKIGELIGPIPELAIMPKFERYTVDYPAAKEFIGRTESKDSVCVGVAGVERDRDAELNGQDGSFRVMVDKQGRWVAGTWRLLREMSPGKDIRLDCAIEEFIPAVPPEGGTTVETAPE